MLVAKPRVRATIRRIIQKLGCPAYSREDFEQEAFIHLWRLQSECPGKTLSWYCRGCILQARDRTLRGRSIDSPRHRHLGRPLAEPAGEADQGGNDLVATGSTPLEDCCALDDLKQLTSRLDPRERRVLILLCKGYTLREVAAELCVSHPAVLKQRQRICAVAAELGLGAGEQPMTLRRCPCAA